MAPSSFPISPKLASGFSALTRSRQSWLKNMYADSARFGALGSFLLFVPEERVDFSGLSAAALRVCERIGQLTVIFFGLTFEIGRGYEVRWVYAYYGTRRVQTWDRALV